MKGLWRRSQRLFPLALVVLVGLYAVLLLWQFENVHFPTESKPGLFCFSLFCLMNSCHQSRRASSFSSSPDRDHRGSSNYLTSENVANCDCVGGNEDQRNVWLISLILLIPL